MTRRTTGSLSDTSQAIFDAGLASNMGALTNGRAIFFTPNGGTLAGQTFLVVDGNGTADYQAGQDYVFLVSGPLPAAPVPDFIV